MPMPNTTLGIYPICDFRFAVVAKGRDAQSRYRRKESSVPRYNVSSLSSDGETGNHPSTKLSYREAQMAGALEHGSLRVRGTHIGHIPPFNGAFIGSDK
jgi:hypothetical protein